MAREPVWLVQAAMNLAQCARLAERDESLPEAQRPGAAREISDRVIDLLRQASAKGYAEPARLKNGSFDPVRQREEFRALEQEIAARAGSRDKL
jgi:hypothetical protein